MPLTADDLREANRRHSEHHHARHYDEALVEVSNRVRSSGSMSKADIGTLISWKRASALLLACAPERMAVWDSRVEKALGKSAPPVVRDRYRHYLHLCEQYVGQLNDTDTQVWTPRMVDTALFWIGGR